MGETPVPGYDPIYTDEESVRELLDGVDEDTDLTPFIEPAEMLVTAKCVTVYSVSEVKILAKYLAAHFYKVSFPDPSEEWIGKAKEVVQNKTDLGLNLTHPGQQLQLLDYKGTLAGIGVPRKRVNVLWLGKTQSERRTSARYPDDL